MIGRTPGLKFNQGWARCGRARWRRVKRFRFFFRLHRSVRSRREIQDRLHRDVEIRPRKIGGKFLVVAQNGVVIAHGVIVAAAAVAAIIIVDVVAVVVGRRRAAVRAFRVSVVALRPFSELLHVDLPESEKTQTHFIQVSPGPRLLSIGDDPFANMVPCLG